MCIEILRFADIEIEKHKSYCNETPTFFKGHRYCQRISI